MGEKKEILVNILYFGHALVIWSGTIWQIIYVFEEQSARDITLFWMSCILLSELLALPRAIKSEYFVWKACHIVAVILVSILLIGVILYR